MTVSNGPRPSSKGAEGKGTGRRGATKFTPQAMEKIKELVAQGSSRDEIANQLDVTVGSLQVTCSRLGISLRRKMQNGSTPHTLNGNGSVGIAITMRHRGKEVAADIPLTSREIERLAVEAKFRDFGIAQLVAQILVAAIKKDMIQEILRDEVPPSVDTAPR
jgi:hypothetical protein